MAEQREIEVKSKPEKKGMSFFQKIMIAVMAIGLIVVIIFVFFFGISSIYQLLFFFAIAAAILVFGFILMKSASLWFAPRKWSPKEDYYTRLINLAASYRPENVKDLYFMGSKSKQKVRAGEIIGLLGVPHLIGVQETDKTGKPVFYDSEILNRKLPKYKQFVYGDSGDTLFIYEKGWFIFKKKHFLRCDTELHQELHGDVYIEDINPVPYGSFFEYPFKQIQKHAGRIMVQQQLEIILATHEHQYDLISQGVDAAFDFNPYFKMLSRQGSEMTGGE